MIICYVVKTFKIINVDLNIQLCYNKRASIVLFMEV